MSSERSPIRPSSSTAAGGLTTGEARRRLETSGPNEIARALPPSSLRIFARQLGSPLVWLLLGAAIVSGLVGDRLDAIAIAAIVAINATVGFVQERRAEN